MEKKLITYDSGDGLSTPDVGVWAIEKYKILYCFANILATGMKKVMNKRVYIDLFAGAGRAKIRESGQIVGTSAIIALSMKDPFDKYIFCEKDKANLMALKERVQREFGDREVVYLHGDSNILVESIENEIPQTNMTLNFCFVDPFASNIEFDTIRKLGRDRKMDFLILLAIGMDLHRNKKLYSEISHDRIDKFLGDDSWRGELTDALKEDNEFRRFIMRKYIDQMNKEGYLKRTLDEIMREVRTPDNVSLYHLAFFSKHDRGYDFWKKARKSGTNKPQLWD
ncbi:MAG: three-Cys-motif partner protein TcmP [bacterium]